MCSQWAGRPGPPLWSRGGRACRVGGVLKPVDSARVCRKRRLPRAAGAKTQDQRVIPTAHAPPGLLPVGQRLHAPGKLGQPDALWSGCVFCAQEFSHGLLAVASRLFAGVTPRVCRPVARSAATVVQIPLARAARQIRVNIFRQREPQAWLRAACQHHQPIRPPVPHASIERVPQCAPRRQMRGQRAGTQTQGR